VRMLLIVFGLLFGVLVLVFVTPGLIPWLAWESNATQSTPGMALPASDPDLERMLGKAAADRMLADARRIGLVTSEAVACGLRDKKWFDDVQLGSSTDTHERLTRATAPGTADPTTVTVHVHARFIAALNAGAARGVLRKQEGTCVALRETRDLRDADQMAERWRANRQVGNYTIR
jgi:hypothetical protein